MSFRSHAVAIPAGKLLIYPVYGKIPSSGSSYPVTNCLFFPVLQRLVTAAPNKSSILTGGNEKRAMGGAERRETKAVFSVRRREEAAAAKNAAWQ
jgi:hypothetical protein